MPPMLTDEDLSLRHLPEVSDYSFSFQIPTASLARADDLMAEDNTFLENANGNSTLATPLPPARVLSRPPTRMLQAFTPRLSTLESSPPSQRPPTSLPSESPSTSYGRPESPSSSINEAPISGNVAGSSEAEGSSKEQGKHEHQDQELQEQDPCLFTSTNSSATLKDTSSLPPAFAKRSSLGSQLEVGHSGVDLPQTESRPQADSEAAQQRNYNSNTSHRSHFGSKPPSTENPRSIAAVKPSRQPVAGGIPKSRNMKKTATTKSEKRQVSSSLPAVTSRAARKRPTQTDKSMGATSADKSLVSDLSLSSFVSGGGAAKRLVMYGQQLLNRQNDALGPITQDTGPNCTSEHRTTKPDEHEIQDVKMNDRQDSRAQHDIHTTGSRDQDDDRDKPLTISQLSPRKRSVAQSSTVEQQDNNAPSALPQLLVLKPKPSAAGKKRQAPAASGPCHDQQARKRGKRSSDAVSMKALSGSTTHVPAHTSASMSSGPQSLVASAASSVMSDLWSSGSGAGLKSPNVIIEKEERRKEANEENVAVDVEHAKTISTSGCGSSSGVVGSGPSKRSKQVVKRPVAIGARSQTRRSSRLSASASGGRTLRPRSVSTSARADVLRASERGKRLAQIRTRKDKDKSTKARRLKDDSGDAEGLQMSTSANGTKRSDVMHPTNSTRPVEFKFASDLRIQVRKGDGQAMTRSSSSLSGSSGAGNNGTIRANPIPDFRAIHAHLDASQAHRKENIHPVIPQPFHWATDERIKERQEFDEVVKEKEREREILLEQIRKEKAEDEEMEIRELRKRAVPKANAVPDWYKDAPKKKKDEETIAG